ncbi:putative glycosyl hydrolase exported protein (plasmid) [Cupriavidus taiwanensis]|uniref:Putative glycosyl hydrolase exported protein n=1 Tax=Cupriavidus taiwanensis TaxID=164546 RepID=A0A375IUB6_9BURK|nr:glycosyl hydrolase [Cupriavidus taiwanensis]SPK77711.1 putative glycosyl hydrolase exported protein [Cupriavidus taiwanensis]
MPKFLAILGCLTSLMLMLGSTVAQAATWSVTSPSTSSCHEHTLFARWSYEGYTLNNDVWGPCSVPPVAVGPQSFWANSSFDWGVTSDQPDTNSIKSYPHVEYFVNKPVGSLRKLTATISATTPAAGAWESTLDIWADAKQHEIMVWLNYTGTSNGCGNVKPISYNWTSEGCAIPLYSNVPLSGSTWNVYVGTNGKNAVYSFLRTAKTNQTTIDVLEIMNYLKSLNYFDDVVVGEIQYGFEITSSVGGLSFVSKNFTVTAE